MQNSAGSSTDRTKKRIRHLTARIFLEIVLKPAGWHAWVDQELRILQDANRSMWGIMGFKMLKLYQWIYGPADDGSDNEL